MQKKILFIIDSLNIGGAEKSLVTLLNVMDYAKYKVDLLMFSRGGEFEKLVPKEVNILEVPNYFKYCAIEWKHIGEKLKKTKYMCAQIKYSCYIRINHLDHKSKAVALWKYCEKCIENNSVYYDTAIAYAQGLPTFYLVDKVRANKKIAWINATYRPQGKYLKFIKKAYEKIDYVNAVSEEIAEEIEKIFDINKKRIIKIRDILDVDCATKMAKMDFEIKLQIEKEKIVILTIGRMCAMKRYDIAINAAKILLDRKISFVWYAIGDGELKYDIEEMISVNNLQDVFILLGSCSNPYPLLKKCDVYVQTSELEGFGITISEAKMFKKPIVTTNFNTVGAQIESGKNGLIVDVSAKAVAEGIIEMLSNGKLRSTCVENLSEEVIENKNEIEKLYKII